VGTTPACTLSEKGIPHAENAVRGLTATRDAYAKALIQKLIREIGSRREGV
jgi:hypothetical protein